MAVLLLGTAFVPFAHAQSFVSSFKVGQAPPQGVVYDSGKGEIFVANDVSSSVSVISDGNNSVVANIPVAGRPVGLAYDSGRGEVFAADDQLNHIAVISDSTDKVVANITTSTPDALAYDPGKGEVFAVNENPGTVAVISVATNGIVANITVGASPYSILYSPLAGGFFVSNFGSYSVSVISDSSNSVVATVTLSSPPSLVAYDSGKGEVFVTSRSGSTVSVISDTTDEVVASGNAGPSADGIAYDSGAGEVYVTDLGNSTASSSVEVLTDSNGAFISGVVIGDEPDAAAYDPVEGEVFVVDNADNLMAVISDGTITATTTTSAPSTTSSTSVVSSTQSGPFVPPSISGQAASIVLGQANFTQGGYDSSNNVTAPSATSTDITAAGFGEPDGVAVDKSGNVWVVDEFNSRVLEFNAPFHNGEAASVVLGLSNFDTQGGCACTTATNLDEPSAIAIDPSGDVWVADYYMGRVLEFTPPFTNGEAASVVLGKPDFTINDLANSQYRVGNLLGEGPVNSTNLNYPTAIAADPSGNIWVVDGANNRVAEFTAPFTNGEAASVVLGQSNFTSSNYGLNSSRFDDPGGIAADSSGNIWVVDYFNQRVLEFVKGSGFVNGQAASVVLGQSGFETRGSSTSSTGLNYPRGVTIDRAGDVWVTDGSSNRVLEFKGPVTTEEAASVVLGQSDFTHNANATSSTGMSYPSLPCCKLKSCDLDESGSALN